MRHRAPRRSRRLAAFLAAVLGLAALTAPFVVGDGPEGGRWEAPTQVLATRSPAVLPSARARPLFLTRAYRAPAALVRPGAGGVLRIPSLGVVAPVDAVGLDGGAMAVPDDPGRTGWLTSTARVGDLVGASVLAGHVSDHEDHPGALATLRMINRGASITWTDPHGRVERFRVTSVRTFARVDGLPASLFTTSGARALHLVTCTERVATAVGGFHYRKNLVVTAVR